LNELEALLILSNIPYIGSIKVRLLIQHYGSAVDALNAPLKDLALFPGFGPKILDAWAKGIADRQWQQEMEQTAREGIEIIPYTSSRYPRRLLEIGDFPLILYVSGTLLKKDERSLAVVGSRQASIYGQEMAKKLSRELGRYGYTIVSGLARGIDTAAHRGALEEGRTLAILGSGLANLYPAENKMLAEEIKQKGALLTEFKRNTPPDKQNFPQRNRIVSGMTLGTLLIEAPRESGAMHTSRKAIEQRRPLFALPGRADSDNFKGNHALIKEQKARLIDDVQDIVSHFDECELPLVFHPPGPTRVSLEKEESDFLNLLPQQELTIEELVIHTKFPITTLNAILMSLVLKKMIKEYPGKIYKKI
jgi:DNA processing protein